MRDIRKTSAKLCETPSASPVLAIFELIKGRTTWKTEQDNVRDRIELKESRKTAPPWIGRRAESLERSN
uniref:Uncharacterized protein n=1 Tax=Ascaris lumbricoides TaxID=6252 RepID=A0A0M3IJC1_ASCLU